MPAKFLVLRDIDNLDRFYEPFIIAHDFAYTFDLEIDTHDSQITWQTGKQARA